MGQKVHPLGFRLGITQEHKGQWFEEMKTYPRSVYQDFVLRNSLLNSFKNADITSIDIERSFNQVIIKVTAARSRLLISNIKQITNFLNVLLKFMTINGNDLEYPKGYTARALANINLSDTSLRNINKWNSKIGHIQHLINRREGSISLKEKHVESGPKVDVISQKDIEGEYPTGMSVDTKLNETSSKSRILASNLPNESDFNQTLESTTAVQAEISDNSQSLAGYEPRLSLLIGSSSQESISNSAFLTAKIIQEQLEKRVPFRRAVKVALRKNPTPKGMKIQVSGRLNGAEIARSEWTRQGRVPLHTLRAQVDYCSHEAKTQYGILGIKVWIFQGYKE